MTEFPARGRTQGRAQNISFPFSISWCSKSEQKGTHHDTTKKTYGRNSE